MKKIIIFIIIVGVVVWAIMRFGVPATPSETSNEAAGTVPTDIDTTESITEDVDSVDVGDLDADFQVIDADLQTL